MARPSLLTHQDAFSYGPALSGDEIRLLPIEPGRGKIRCSLTTHRLGSDLVYDALSYAWGSDRKPFPIICNDKRIYVTKSLFDALGQLRRNGHAALLWVDAVCINQADKDEKSVQVGMMRDIYKNADHVRVWLGPAQETDEAGLELLRRIHQRFGMILPGDMTPDESSLQRLGLPDFNDPSWKSVFQILHRPYFTRMWIVQEFLLARRCTILVGHHSIDGDAVLAFAGACNKCPRLIETGINSPINITWVVDSSWVRPPPGATVTQRGDGSSSQINIPFASTPPLMSLWFLKGTLLRSGGLLMLELLNHTRLFKSKDPRDRIFALVGLATASFNPEFRRRLVDYNKTFLEVQIELTNWFMMNQQNAGSMIFSYAGHSQASQQQLEPPRPSWVPDWSPSGMGSSCTWPLAATFYSYSDPALRPHRAVDRRMVSDTGLELSCTVLDRVAATVDQIPYLTSTALLRDDPEIFLQYHHEMEAWDDACWDLAVSGNPTQIYAATGERLFEAFWRALVFDTDPGTRGAQASHKLEISYQTWASCFGTVNELRKMKTETPPESGFWGRMYRATKCSYLIARADIQAKLGDAFNTAFRNYVPGRKFCATGNGYIGWVPFAARVGDLVCYFEGNALPFVIRESEDGEFRLIGDCYLHGFMRGPGEAVVRTRKIVLN